MPNFVNTIDELQSEIDKKNPHYATMFGAHSNLTLIIDNQEIYIPPGVPVIVTTEQYIKRVSFNNSTCALSYSKSIYMQLDREPIYFVVPELDGRIISLIHWDENRYHFLPFGSPRWNISKSEGKPSWVFDENITCFTPSDRTQTTCNFSIKGIAY